MRLKSTIIALMVATTPLLAQTNVRKYNASTEVATGITYYLPQTEVVVTATAERTIAKPGPFYQYAERYLGTNDIITAESDEWKLIDVKIIGRAIVDPAKQYEVMYDKKGVSNNITFGKHSIIASVNRTDCAANPSGMHGFQECVHNRPRPHKPQKDCTLDTAIRFDMTKLNSDALIAASVMKMAETAAQQIYHIRESRTALLSGDMDNLPDGKALKTMLKKLDETERELTALFVGKRVTYTEKRDYTYIPTNAVKIVKNYTLFRISSRNGLVDADDVMGTPVYLSVVPQVRMAPSPEKYKEPKKSGFFYNVPGEATVTVSDFNAISVNRTMTMPQFGYTANLPTAITDSPSATIIYNTQTGEIKSIKR